MSERKECLHNQAHLWCRREEGDLFCIGVSDYAQDSLGEIVYVDFPDLAAEVVKNQSFGTIESTKVVSELVSPVQGVVAACNQELLDDPTLANADPYGKGWLIKVEVVSDQCLSDLMSYEDYSSFIEGN